MLNYSQRNLDMLDAIFDILMLDQPTRIMVIIWVPLILLAVLLNRFSPRTQRNKSQGSDPEGKGLSTGIKLLNFLAATGSNCVQFSGIDTHVFYPMGDFSQGLWEFSMKVFTGSGGGGFLQTQHYEEPALRKKV